MMSPHCGLEHTDLTLTIRAVLIHGQEKNMFIFLNSNTSENNRHTSLFSALTCVNTEATGLLKQIRHKDTSIRYCYLPDNQRKPTCPEEHG